MTIDKAQKKLFKEYKTKVGFLGSGIKINNNEQVIHVLISWEGNLEDYPEMYEGYKLEVEQVN